MSDFIPRYEDSEPDQGFVPSYDDSEPDVSPSRQQGPSAAGSVLGGLGQGISFGWGDELAAAAGSALDGLWGEDIPYEKRLEYARRIDKKDKDTNPGAYLGGEIAGGLATAVVPAGAAAKGAQTLGQAAKAATLGGAGIGALQGLGYSEADLRGGDIGGAALDTAIGGGVGALGGAIGAGGGKALSYGLRKAKDIKSGIGKTGIKLLTELDNDMIDEAYKRTKPITKGRSFNEIADDFMDMSNQLRDKASAGSSKAFDALEGKYTDSSDLLDAGLDSIDQQFPAKGGSKTAPKRAELEAYLEETIGGREKIPMSDLKRKIQEIDRRPEFKGDPDYQAMRRFYDSIAKQDPDYAEAMKPVAEATGLSKDLQKLTEKGPRGYRQFSPDTATRNLKQAALKPNVYSEKADLIDRAGQSVGKDLLGEAKEQGLYEAFDKSMTRGSKGTLGGAIAGRAMESAVMGGLGAVGGYGVSGDPTIGFAVGAGLGAARDKWAGPLVRGMINRHIRKNNGVNSRNIEMLLKLAPERLGVYANPLKQALMKGEQGLGTYHFLQYKRDPQYRQVIDTLDEQGEEDEFQE